MMDFANKVYRFGENGLTEIELKEEDSNMKELNIKEVKNMEDLHCYNYYEEDEDYSERDEIKIQVQNNIIEKSDNYEFGMDHLMFIINNNEYMFYICDEFINMSISLNNEILISSKNPNEIIEYVNNI